MDSNQIDTWCCETDVYGHPCEYPAGYTVIYGNAPDDITLMCEGHVHELWEPTWEVIELLPEERDQYASDWSAWVAEHRAS